MKLLKKATVLFLAVTGFLFVQCSANKGENANENVTAEDTLHQHEADVTKTEAGKPEFTVDQMFQKQLSDLFTSYLALKDAFVDSDANKVKTQAGKTSEALAKVDMKLVTEQAHSNWMTFDGELSSSLAKIQESADVEQQREHFSDLSNSMYKVIKSYGLAGVKAYYEFCPMAFDNKGAYWLSESEKIRNPYFGEKMLGCGSVEETLQ
jgi:hypothetical protein